MDEKRKTLREVSQDISKHGLGCNCDLDNWEPQRDSGHSRVCRIDKYARRVYSAEITIDQVPKGRPL